MSALALALLLTGPADPAADAPPEHLRLVAPGLWSGAAPVGDAAFAALAARGVRTVVSVDGPVPDAATAARFGLRTVHLPIGYDGVPDEAAAKLSAVMRLHGAGKEGGGVFVHCHHGKHRGPAAAAICGRAAGRLSAFDALAYLETAGADPRYAGLWASVRTFDPTATNAAAASLAPRRPARRRAAGGVAGGDGRHRGAARGV